LNIAKNLLGAIENNVRRGDPVAVVRALRDLSDECTTVSVYDGEVFPPVADRKLTDQVLSAVRSLIAKGSAVDLLDVEDEKGTRVKLVVELIKPKLELIVFGAGHVGQSVALIGALTGYAVTVVDDREEFASRNRFPDPRIGLLVSDFENAARELSISSTTAVVIVTRGHQYDELCLKSVIRSNATYIGMIGSRRRVLSVFKKLTGEGFLEAELQRVHAPIGLPIAARSPQEIGVSIMAQIIDHVNNPGHDVKGDRNVI
jgi:xanthine dehydrogenase accessory factor